MKIIVQEREILVFSVLQWVSIGFGYFLWVQVLSWIPEEVWRSTETSDSSSSADYVLIAWSFVIVGIVALPLGILNACVGAVHLLRRQGKPSTIAACLQVVLPRAWPLWVLSWMDSWITVNQILDRLPTKKEAGDDSANSAGREALYYAWKLGTIGVLPAILSGRGLIDAGKDSVLLVKSNVAGASLLRGGYSLVCWMVGGGTYVGTAFLLNEKFSDIYDFYVWAGIPILLAAGLVVVLLRPIYTIACVDLYADYLHETNQSLVLPQPPTRLTSVIVAVVVLIAIVAAFVLFREQLGVAEMLSTPHG